jgi:DNA polymerase kappa
MIEKVKNSFKNKASWDITVKNAKWKYAEYKKEMTIERTWFHIDMDMFYAACEIREKPGIADKAVAVGDYAMIMTTNYVARKFGVRAAMPGFIGKQLCP